MGWVKGIFCLVLIAPLVGCATIGVQGVVDFGNEMIGDPEQAKTVLESACRSGPFHWGYLDGLGLLSSLTVGTTNAADSFQSYCDRIQSGEALTAYELGYALGIYHRLAYSLAKSSAIRVMGILGATGGIPTWLP